MLFNYTGRGGVLLSQKILFGLSLLLISNFAFGIKNFVLISAPGSGKGTFSQYMIKKHDYLQICPGDLFRNEIALGTELGKMIQPIVDRGDYVDENIVCELIEKYINEACCQNRGFIIDGFPRSIFSFNFLHSLLEGKNLGDKVYFVQFIASDEICANRILGRLVCMNCFKVYNKCSNKPECENICDDCGFNLSSRKADTSKIVQKRLEYFHSNIESLIEVAQEYYPIIKINSECFLLDLELHYEKLLKN